MKSGLIIASALLSGVSLFGQGLQPSAVALTPAIQVNQGVVSQPLTLKVTAVGTLTPMVSFPIQFSSDTPDLVLLGAALSTDPTGQASVSCIGLRPTTGHVIAMLPTGGLLMFEVTVTAPPAPSPLFEVSEIGRIAWQGTSTVDSGHSFSAKLTDQSGAPLAGVPMQAAVLQGNVQLLNGLGAASSSLSITTQLDGSLAFHASFPASSSADDFSVIGLSAQGSSSVFLVHAFPQNAPPVLQAVSSSGSGPLPLIDGNPPQRQFSLSLLIPPIWVSME